MRRAAAATAAVLAVVLTGCGIDVDDQPRDLSAVPFGLLDPSTTTTTDPTSTALSALPNCRIAHSFSGVGVRSMTVEPTASTGEAAGTVSAATRWPAASAGS